MLLRRLGVLVVVLTALSAPVTAASASPTSWGRPAAQVLTINGAVSDPVGYTMSQLTALPTETVTLAGRGGSGGVKVTGVSLDQLVTIASPVLPAVKNALLRAVVTASGPFGHPVSFALGELDPNFGDHDAVIVLSVGGRPLTAGPALAVPGDQAPVRDLPLVNRIRVGVASRR